MSRPSDRKECCKLLRDSRLRTKELSKDLNSVETKFGVSVNSIRIQHVHLLCCAVS